MLSVGKRAMDCSGTLCVSDKSLLTLHQLTTLCDWHWVFFTFASSFRKAD